MNNQGDSTNWTDMFDNWLESIKGDLENALTNQLGNKTDIEVESARAFNADEIPELFTEETMVLECGFDAEALGTWHFILDRSLSAEMMKLTGSGSGEGSPDAEEPTNVLAEIWKSLMDTAAASLSTMLGMDVSATKPVVGLDSSEIIQELDIYTGVRWGIQISESAQGSVLMLVPFDISMVFDSIGQELSHQESEPPEMDKQESEPTTKKSEMKMQPSGNVVQPLVRPVEFEDLKPGDVHAHVEEPRNIDMLLDVSLPITIELGRSKMLIKDVLALGAGSVIELDKLSGEPVDMFVNDKLFAKGEVVVIEENFGVRITELIKIDERLKALQ